jgi:hypothetical protein
MQKNMMAKCPVNTREPDCPQMRSKFNEDIQLYQNESNYIERQCGVRVDYVNLQYTRLEQF